VFAEGRFIKYWLRGVDMSLDTLFTAENCYYRTEFGQIILGDSLEVLRKWPDNSVDLVVTSPPFALVRKKEYGNVPADEYVDWFRPFAKEIHRVLKESGSFVIDLGGTWNRGIPTRHLYHFKLLIMLCEEYGFHLAQDFYWWNPSKLPTPAEWVTVRRIRVKDAVNTVWWLAKTPWPKASNRRILWPYSEAMVQLLQNGYKPKLRPSGHDISEHFLVNNGAAIPPNLIAIPNTESNSYYLQYCREKGLKPHPARFPREVPEFFVRMTTDPGDIVVDPFAGSCVTGEVCERLRRRWICIELIEEYVKGAIARFAPRNTENGKKETPPVYRIYHPAAGWGNHDNPPLPPDGGKKRPTTRQAPLRNTTNTPLTRTSHRRVAE